MSAVVRETRETKVRVTVARGTGVSNVATTESFLDHMLVVLARYSQLDLDVQASGDLKHHLIEDVAITLGEALLPLTQTPIVRFAFAQVAMDDALVAATLDAGGRTWFEGRVPSTLYAHFFRSLCENARLTLHLEIKRGTDRHHVIEAAFKALGFALRTALAPSAEVESTLTSASSPRGSLILASDFIASSLTMLQRVFTGSGFNTAFASASTPDRSPMTPSAVAAIEAVSQDSSV